MTDKLNNSRHEQMSETEKYIKSVLGLKDSTMPIYFLNETFDFTEPRLNRDRENKRWYIRYSIKKPGDNKYRYVKEFGVRFFQGNLNLITDLKEREAKFQELINLIRWCLIKGIDTTNQFTKEQIHQYMNENKSCSFTSIGHLK